MGLKGGKGGAAKDTQALRQSRRHDGTATGDNKLFGKQATFEGHEIPEFKHNWDLIRQRLYAEFGVKDDEMAEDAKVNQIGGDPKPEKKKIGADDAEVNQIGRDPKPEKNKIGAAAQRRYRSREREVHHDLECVDRRPANQLTSEMCQPQKI